MQTYRLKPGKLGRKLQGIYRGMERAVVGRYQKIEDAFVSRFLEPSDETHNGKED
ncbi:hypothetical protein [uncultured Subdoligranulum sp.]|uniref:hypothetical protein n=1 Tax=uncultured Subdoligranulum sp. TaxID=512298 RepID=UPI0025E24696|nr:hypothetical protein [uncultured Subdoligranulum sp.]